MCNKLNTLQPQLTKGFILRRESISFPTGEPPSTYSAMFTPRAPVSDDRGDRTEDGSLPGKLPGRRCIILMGFETACSGSLTVNMFVTVHYEQEYLNLSESFILTPSYIPKHLCFIIFPVQQLNVIN